MLYVVKDGTARYTLRSTENNRYISKLLTDSHDEIFGSDTIHYTYSNHYDVYNMMLMFNYCEIVEINTKVS